MAKISAKRTGGPTITVEADFGDDLDAMCENYGDAVVYSHAKGSLTVALQGFIRAQEKAGKSEKEIQKLVDTWKPGQKRQGKSPAEKLRAQMEQMSPEERAALLKEFAGGGGKKK